MFNCRCDKCIAACKFKPGWFLPKELEKVADYLEMTLEDLFRTKLIIDWYEKNPVIFVISPCTKNNHPGREFPFDPRGECIFLNNENQCDIYPVRPYECRMINHDRHNKYMHRRIALRWIKYQHIIERLLKRKPLTNEPNSFSEINELQMIAYYL